MRKTLIVAVVVLVAAILLVAAAPGFEQLARLTVWNRTGSTIYLQLTTPKTDGRVFYYLTVKPGLSVFTVQRKVYDITYWSCGSKMTGIVDILTQLQLTFTDCAYLHRWTYKNKYSQEVDSKGRPLWVWVDPVTGGWTFLYQEGNDVLGDPRLVDFNGDPVAYVPTEMGPKYPMYYSGNVAPNTMNNGEPGMEKVHNTLKRWEWIGDDVRCDVTASQYKSGVAPWPVLNTQTVTVMYGWVPVQQSVQTLAFYDIWGWCRVGYHWGTRSYKAPSPGGNYWDSWRLSYNTNSARSLHWLLRATKSNYPK